MKVKLKVFLVFSFLLGGLVVSFLPLKAKVNVYTDGYGIAGFAGYFSLESKSFRVPHKVRLHNSPDEGWANENCVVESEVVLLSSKEQTATLQLSLWERLRLGSPRYYIIPADSQTF